MSLSVKIHNFLGGIKGREGQYRGDIQDSLLHAENFIVDRAGAMRNRPAWHVQGITKLSTDRTVQFFWGSDVFTLVYDPAFAMPFYHIENIDTHLLADPFHTNNLLSNYTGDFNNPVFSFGSVLASVPTSLFTEDNTFHTMLTNYRSGGINTQQEVDIFITWANLIKTKYQLYLAGLIDRNNKLETENFFLLLDPNNYDTATTANVGADLNRLQQRNAIQALRYRGESGDPFMPRSRFLLYKNGNLINTNIFIPFPLTYDSGVSRRAGEDLSLTSLQDGTYREKFILDEDINHTYEVRKGVDHVFLVNQSGVLPPLVMDMRQNTLDQVYLYDMRCAWMADSSDTPQKNIRNILQIPSYLTLDEFKKVQERSFLDIRFDTGLTSDMNVQTFADQKQTADADATQTDDNLRPRISTEGFHAAPQINEPDSEISAVIDTEANRVGVHFRLDRDLLDINDRDAIANIGKDAWTVTLFYNHMALLSRYDISILREMFGGAANLSRWPATGDSYLDTQDAIGRVFTFFNPLFGKGLIQLHITDSGGIPTGTIENRNVHFPIPILPVFTSRRTYLNLFMYLGGGQQSDQGALNQRSIASNDRRVMGHTYFTLRKLTRLGFDPAFLDITVDTSGIDITKKRGGVADHISRSATWPYGMNSKDLFKFSETKDGRLSLIASPKKENALAITSNRGADGGSLDFDEGENQIADPADPVIDNGFRLFLSPDGGPLEIFWTQLVNNALHIGTSAGNFNYATLNITAVADTRLNREDNPSRFRPIELLSATYQILNDRRTLYILEQSEELRRQQYVSLSTDIDDYIREEIDGIFPVQDTGRIAVHVNKRLFIGLIKANGTLAWTEVTFGGDIINVQEDKGVLFIEKENESGYIDFKEFTPIEDEAILSITLPTPMAYISRSDIPTPKDITKFKYNRGYIFGEITQRAQIGSIERPAQRVSNLFTSVQFEDISLAHEEDAAYFVFGGRKVRLSSAMFEIGRI